MIRNPLVTIILCVCVNGFCAEDRPTTNPSTKPIGQRVEVIFTSGHDTDERDKGRPVALIAAALGVTQDVFREAFSHVHPARNGPPTREEAQKNKEALLSRLAKYGVTNERLDEVSDYYRYRPGDREIWKHRDARAVAIVAEGKIVSFEITDAGAGYSSPPVAKVKDFADVRVNVEIQFGKDLATNGAVKALAVVGK